MWHWVDLTIAGIIGLSILTGLVRGFVKELISLCVWILAIWVAYTYSQTFSTLLTPYIKDSTIKTVIAFVALLFSVLIGGAIFNALFSFFLKRTGLGGTDRILGMGFGFIRGVLIVSVLIVAVKFTAIPNQEEQVSGSYLYPKFNPVVAWLGGILPNFIDKAKSMEEKQKAPLQKIDSSSRT
jgi:membrane protein required for colicin V production